MNLLLPMGPWYQSRDHLHNIPQNLVDQHSLADGPPPGTKAEMPWLPLHKNLVDYPTLANGLPWVPKPRWLAYHYTKLSRWTYFGQKIPPLKYQSRDALNTTTKNLTDVPTLANSSSPQYQIRDALNTSTPNKEDKPILANGIPPVPEQRWFGYHYIKTWQINLLLLMDSPVPEQRSLAYHYTKLGRWTYFGQWNTHMPRYQIRDPSKTSTPNLADNPTLANGPSQIQEQRWLAYHYTKLGRWAYVGQKTLPWNWEQMPWILLHKTCRWTYFDRWTSCGQWTPQYKSRDDSHTTTQNLADETTLADGPLWYHSRDDLHALYKTWQMNLLWPMDTPPLTPPVPE